MRSSGHDACIPVSGYYEWRDHSLPAEETVTDVEGWEFIMIGGRPYFRSFAEAKAAAQAHLDPLRVAAREVTQRGAPSLRVMSAGATKANIHG